MRDEPESFTKTQLRIQYRGQDFERELIVDAEVSASSESRLDGYQFDSKMVPAKSKLTLTTPKSTLSFTLVSNHL